MRMLTSWVRFSNILKWGSSRNVLLSRHRSTSSLPDHKQWTSREVRSTFIDYFKAKNHLYVHSSSVIPKKNEGTYFINAGMNQFKPVFLSEVDPSSDMARYKRAVNSQKCIRVGGKHNDLSEVGRDTSHHTFFEMMGSWSFGDYFKEEACSMAWDLLTNVYKLSPDRLYVTYFSGSEELGLGPDEQCRDIWLKLGVSPERVLPFDDVDNFWDMGETGPCGPCTEIHYDHHGYGVVEGAMRVNAGFEDVVELWNLVFMQYHRLEDGCLRILPLQHVDTGMGLERLTAVLQGVTSNYHTDLFMPMFDTIHKSSIASEYSDRYEPSFGHEVDTAYRIVADHARMMTVAISDGVIPGRGDRNMKLRSVMYEAMKQAKDVLGAPPGLLTQLAVQVVDSLGEAFPELGSNVSGVCEVIEHTERRYLEGCQTCVKSLHKALNHYGATQMLSGDQIHELLVGRFGKPTSLEILHDVAANHGITLDIEGYHRRTELLKKARINAMIEERSEEEESIMLDPEHVAMLHDQHVPPTDDSAKYNYTASHSGYSFPVIAAKVVGIFNGVTFAESTSESEEGEEALTGLLVDKSNFYAEEGGQVADKGYITNQKHGFRFRVTDVQHFQEYVLHIGVVETGTIALTDTVELAIDAESRFGCMRNHTATHVLNHALTTVLGCPVLQQGSRITPDRLTFDFSTLKTCITEADLLGVQMHLSDCVNAQLPVYRKQMKLHEAKLIPGLRCIPDAVYPNTVRVISLGYPVGEESVAVAEAAEGFSHSVELCGGTHLDNTAHIGAAVLTHFTGTQQGSKCATVLTGALAKQAFEDSERVESKVRQLQSWIESNTNTELWCKTADDIQKLLGSGMSLPKVLRDRVLADMEPLMLVIHGLKNRSKKEKLRQSLEELKEPGKALITALSFEQPRDVMAVLSACSFPDPVMILSQQASGKGKTFLGVCYVPRGHGSSAQQWALHITQTMGGHASPPGGKYTKDTTLFKFTFSPQKKLEHAILLGKTFIDLYT